MPWITNMMNNPINWHNDILNLSIEQVENYPKINDGRNFDITKYHLESLAFGIQRGGDFLYINRIWDFACVDSCDGVRVRRCSSTLFMSVSLCSVDGWWHARGGHRLDVSKGGALAGWSASKGRHVREDRLRKRAFGLLWIGGDIWFGWSAVGCTKSWCSSCNGVRLGLVRKARERCATVRGWLLVVPESGCGWEKVLQVREGR